MEVRKFLPEQPAGTMSLDNLRNNFLALYQGDLRFLRPRTDYIHDDFEYADPSATLPWVDSEGNEYANITLDNTIRKFGNYSMKVEFNEESIGLILRVPKLSNLSGFLYVDFWIRSTKSSDTVRFLLHDGINESYWEFTITTANTWQNVTLDLSTPDGNNGTDADLSSVNVIFFQLDEAETYHFDQIRFICGNSIVIEGTENSEDVAGHYRRNIWMNSSEPFWGTTWVVSDFNIPASSIRKDLVVLRYYDPSYLAIIIEGDAYNYPAPEVGDIPICYVYLRAGQARIVDFISKDDYATDGYIAADVRPFLQVDSNRVSIGGGGDYATEVIITANELTGAKYIDFYVGNALGTARRQMLSIDYTGLQLYAAGVPAGAEINEFSTDGTFDGNSDSAVPTEKATKSYVDSKLIKHFLSGGLVTVSGNNLVVDPAFLWLNSKTLTEVAQITKDATVSGNYIGTDISAAAGFVYVYATDDGAGGYDVYLSGDEPNRSDCNDSATTGKMIYRKFDTTWYRYLGARYKAADAVWACSADEDGFVSYEAFPTVISGTTFNNDYAAYVPLTAKRGLFQLCVATSAGAVPTVTIKPSISSSSIHPVVGHPVAGQTAYGEVTCFVTNDSGTQKINASVSSASTGTCYVKTVGYWEVR